MSAKKAAHGFSTEASDKDVASYFKEQAKKARATAKKQHYRSGQLSSKQASSQLLNYFAQEEALAAKPQTPAKPSKASRLAAAKPAHKFGLSGAASRKDFEKYFAAEAHPPPPSYVGFSAAAAGADLKNYFATELLAMPAEQHAVHGMSSDAARADLAHYFSAPPNKRAAPAAAATPAMIFSRLRDHKRASAAEKAKAQADAAAARRLSSAAATKDLAAYFAQPAAKAAPHAARKAAPAKPAKQALAAYGAGVEDDNAVEVRRRPRMAPPPRAGGRCRPWEEQPPPRLGALRARCASAACAAPRCRAAPIRVGRRPAAGVAGSRQRLWAAAACDGRAARRVR